MFWVWCSRYICVQIAGRDAKFLRILPRPISFLKGYVVMKKESISEKRYLILNQLKNDKEVIDLVAIGSSMEPLIKSNSIVYIEFEHIESINVGDVVAFYDEHGVSVHRCIKKTNKMILERGDGCNLWNKCKSISDREIIGKMIYVEYDNKRLITETLGYKIYSELMVALGNLSNLIGCIKDRDNSHKPHISLKNQRGLASNLINRFILVIHKILIKYEKVE